MRKNPPMVGIHFLNKMKSNPPKSEELLAFLSLISFMVFLILAIILQGQWDVNMGVIEGFFLGLCLAFMLSVAIHAKFRKS